MFCIWNMVESQNNLYYRGRPSTHDQLLVPQRHFMRGYYQRPRVQLRYSRRFFSNPFMSRSHVLHRKRKRNNNKKTQNKDTLKLDTKPQFFKKKAGETVRLPCRGKKGQTFDQQSVSWQVGEDYIVQENKLVLKMKRYSISRPRGVFIGYDLVISKATALDSGHYECVVKDLSKAPEGRHAVNHTLVVDSEFHWYHYIFTPESRS